MPHGAGLFWHLSVPHFNAGNSCARLDTGCSTIQDIRKCSPTTINHEARMDRQFPRATKPRDSSPQILELCLLQTGALTALAQCPLRLFLSLCPCTWDSSLPHSHQLKFGFRGFRDAGVSAGGTSHLCFWISTPMTSTGGRATDMTLPGSCRDSGSQIATQGCWTSPLVAAEFPVRRSL